MFRRKVETVRPTVPTVQGGEGGVTFTRLPAWLESVLGLQSNLLPSRLRVPSVQPVVEVNQPVVRSIRLPEGVVGSNWTLDIPAGVDWEILVWSFVFSTDANVANRAVGVRVQDITFPPDTRELLRVGSNYTQVASLEVAYTVMPGGGVIGDTSSQVIDLVVIPLPSVLRLPGGSGRQIRLLTETQNIQAGDRVLRPMILIREWPGQQAK